MKIFTPEIYWHGDRDRIMSIDFYPNTNLLITCGAESESKMYIKLWEIKSDNNVQNIIQNKDMSKDTATQSYQIVPTFLHELSGAHTSTVNTARFSPNGMYLATGGDDSAVVIWVQKSRFVSIGSTEEVISWGTYKILRGHLSDVYDLQWSPDSKYLISGSVDNCAIIWNIEKGKSIHKIMDHTHFVQGVSWDPRNKYVTTESCDRSVRIYKIIKLKNNDIKFCYMNQIKKFELENNNNNIEDKMEIEEDINTSNNQILNKQQALTVTPINTSSYYYFVDETQCPTFVRRHCWSPDGSICLLVSGIMKSEIVKDEIDFVVWGITRHNISYPSFYIPMLDKCAVCARFCPMIFKKNESNENNINLLDLPYAMVYAIGTLDSVYIYRTDSIKPLFAVTNIHYLAITDLTWKGAELLAISSSDGYISFCQFDKNELGIILSPEDLEDEKLKNNYQMYLNIDINKNVMANNYVTINVRPKKKNNNNIQSNTNEQPNSPSNTNTKKKIIPELISPLPDNTSE